MKTESEQARGSRSHQAAAGFALLALFVTTCRAEKRIGRPISPPDRSAFRSSVGLATCDRTPSDCGGACPTGHLSRCVASSATGPYLVTCDDQSEYEDGYDTAVICGKGLQQSPIGVRVSYDASWSGDGKLVAVTGDTKPDPRSLAQEDKVYIVDRLGRLLGQEFKLPGTAFRVAFSPDGTHIVALAAPEEDIGDYLHGQAYLIDRLSGAVRPVLAGRHVRSPVWSPSGRSFTLAQDGGMFVFVVATDNLVIEEIDTAQLATAPASRVRSLAWPIRDKLWIQYENDDIEEEGWVELPVDWKGK